MLRTLWQAVEVTDELLPLLPQAYSSGRRHGAFMPCLLAQDTRHATPGGSCGAAEVTAATATPEPLEKVPALLFVPCRTATRGQFPLNGTYFQTNEVFLDHASLANPIMVRSTPVFGKW